jgi:imidazolonepropionase-like amidohydrolase
VVAESLEPSTGDGVDAAWREASERRRPARHQGTVEAGKRADLLVVNGAPLADVTRLRRRESLTLGP